MNDMTNPKEHTVAVILEGSSFTAVPGDLLTAPSDHVIFQNLTDKKVTVLFPDESLFGAAKALELDPNGSGEYKSQVVSWKPNAETSGKFDTSSSPVDHLVVDSEAKGSYPYAVYYHGGKEFAHRSAMPRIIVVR